MYQYKAITTLISMYPLPLGPYMKYININVKVSLLNNWMDTLKRGRLLNGFMLENTVLSTKLN